MPEINRLLIGGVWVAPESEERSDIVDSSTEEPIASVSLAGKADMDRAVTAARNAFDRGEWRSFSAEQRAVLLDRLGSELGSRCEAIASTVSRENGCSITTSPTIQAMAAAGTVASAARLARGLTFEETRTGMMENPVLVVREPVGVAAAIVPWNVPLTIAMMKMAPALAAGCTVVVKPDPKTALDATYLAESVVASGFPEGVVSVVPADRDAAEYLVSHRDVDKVSFTGSTRAGRRVASICGSDIRRCTLELGGKSAAIIAEDADIDAVLPQLLPAMTMINGQACIAQTRVLVPRTRRAAVTDAIVAAFEALTVGNALDPDTDIGPLVSQEQRARVLDYIRIGVEEGATVATGGEAADVDGRGYFVQPTLLTDVDRKSTVAQKEIFGPVICLISYDGIDDAIDIANDSDYGLSGSVWTRDAEFGLAVARRVRTGTINVNYSVPESVAPFGGVKASGIGRESGSEALDAYLEYKSIGVREHA
ncbi:MAG: aldehyde dehydrogenase [Rhodococcus fascians]